MDLSVTLKISFKSCRFFPTFLFIRNFIVLHFIQGYDPYLFSFCIRYVLKFVFLSMDMQLFQQYSVVFVEKTTIYKFFIALPVYLHKKLPQPYLWLSIYGLCVLFHWFICLHFNIQQHFSYCGLIISLKMGQSESFDFIFSFFVIVLSILVPLTFLPVIVIILLLQIFLMI